MRRAKFSLKDYWEPTPAGFRKIGDLGNYLCVGIASAIVTHFPLEKKWILSSLIIGLVFKAITNFFTDKKEG